MSLTNDQTILDFLQAWPELQRWALRDYAMKHGITYAEALKRLAVEALAIDAMCPEISEDK